jgi:hypothetical protein
METPQKSVPGLEEEALAWRPAAFCREYTPLDIGETGATAALASAKAANGTRSCTTRSGSPADLDLAA